MRCTTLNLHDLGDLVHCLAPRAANATLYFNSLVLAESASESDIDVRDQIQPQVVVDVLDRFFTASTPGILHQWLRGSLELEDVPSDGREYLLLPSRRLLDGVVKTPGLRRH